MATENKDERIKVAIALMHFDYGGAERMVAHLASHLDLTKCDVRVFCIYGDPKGNEMERMVEGHGVRIIHLGKGLGFSLRHVSKMCKLLEDFDADVVHTHLGAAIYCAPWAMKTGHTMLHTLHSVPEMEFGVAKRAFMRMLYRCGHAVPVAISPKNKELTATFYGLPSSEVEMVVNPVDISQFSSINSKPWDERTWDFVMVARFSEEKNHRVLVEAVARLVDGGSSHKSSFPRIALVGSGSLEDQVRELVHSCGLDDVVAFLGTRDDVAAVLSDSRCFILPSNYEGLPMSILEAMAAGLPVLATAVGGVPDVVEDGITGLLVESGDAAALASAMMEIMEDPCRSKAMGDVGRAAVGKYDCVIVSDEYTKLYERYSKGGDR